MTYNLTLTGENPQELANFLTALAATNGTNNFDALAAAKAQILNAPGLSGNNYEAPAPVSGDAAVSAANGAVSANGKAVAPKKATSAAAKKAAVQKNAEAQSAANTPPDENAIDGFSAAIENAAASDDFDFGLDLGTKTTGWTVEEVREKAKEVVNAGKQLQLRESLNQFGAASISTLDAQHYDDFMASIGKITY